MQFLVLALAAAGLVAANPVPNVDTSSSTYQWSVTKFLFSRTETDYEYSMKIAGPTKGSTPGFTGTCSGTSGTGFTTCSLLPLGTESIPTVRTKVNIVDGTPKLTVKMTYEDSNECDFTYKGSHSAQVPSATTPIKFTIAPVAHAVC